MGTPDNALQAAIYNRLTTYTPLTDLVGTKIYDWIPETAQPPFVRIGETTSIDWSTKDRNGWDMTLTIHSWDFEVSGAKSVNAIGSAIYDALHRQESNITPAGFNLIMCQSVYGQPVQDAAAEPQGDRFWHYINRFRVLIQQ